MYFSKYARCICAVGSSAKEAPYQPELMFILFNGKAQSNAQSMLSYFLVTPNDFSIDIARRRMSERSNLIPCSYESRYNVL